MVKRTLQTYGDRVLQGGTDWDATGLIRLAGWRSGLWDSQAKNLHFALARSGQDDIASFLAMLEKDEAH